MTTETSPAATRVDLLQGIRPEALRAPESGIVEVFNYGLDRQGLIPLWVGESDVSTPAFICDAATRSLEAGETFYTHQRGAPELRRAIARYMTGVYGSPFAESAEPFAPERFFVTIGGMHALQIAIRLVAGVGDEVVVPTPAWPNFEGALTTAGARMVQVPLRFEGGEHARWSLDLDDVTRAITPQTRAIVVNSPANPTGWIASRSDLSGPAGPCPHARAVDHRGRDLRPLRLRRASRPVLPRRHRAGRSRAVRPDTVQELDHDGLAGRLARSAGGARRRDREHDPIFDLGRRGAGPARRRGGAFQRRALPGPAGRARARESRDIMSDGARTDRAGLLRPAGGIVLSVRRDRGLERHPQPCVAPRR